MRQLTAAAVTAMLLSALTLSAGETSAKKPLGQWARTKDDTTTKFHFTAATLHFVSEGGLGKIDLEADYAISKDGKTLFGRIRTVKEGGGPAKGDLFSFGYSVKGDTLTITDLKGTGAVGIAQSIQGEYKKEDSKKD
jgi:hypothetical protein